MADSYSPALTMREARDLYFEKNGFGKDGGYDAAWVDFKLGPIPMPFPNTEARKRAVPYHDLHHILTGYETDTISEFEISAWEIGAGCKRFMVPWQLNLAGMATGLVVAPLRIWRAFVRGRRSETLYGKELEPLLDRTVADARAEAGLEHDEEPRATAKDAALFLVALAAGSVVSWTTFALMVPLAPFGVLAGILRRANA
jgi:hypothetical protein